MLAFATVTELGRLLAKRKISPVELAQMFLSRIERLDPQLNAFRTVAPERVLAQAREAERELARGRRRGTLHGIPFALKDNIWTRGTPTTAGASILRSCVPSEDATVVRRLRRSGAVLLGKTNMHEFAYGITSQNPHFGDTHNPWAVDRMSGGSSGGSAAAVAAGLSVAALGTDTGGSVRIPAALCGVVGLKPTFGRISVHGVVPLARSFDHVGVLARSVADTALLLGALAGRDPLDPTSVAQRSGEFYSECVGRRRQIRVGRPKEHFWERLDPEVRRLAEVALEDLVQHGAIVREVSLPSVSAAVEAANMVALVEARLFHEEAGYFPAHAAEYGADVRERLEQGESVRAVDYLRALELLRRSCAEFTAALAGVDALVLPTVPVAAPLLGREQVRVGKDRESVRAALVRLNRPANFTGLPAISVPCGFTRAALPAGLEFIGSPWEEGLLLGIAHVYERTHDWRSAHPPIALRP